MHYLITITGLLILIGMMALAILATHAGRKQDDRMDDLNNKRDADTR